MSIFLSALIQHNARTIGIGTTDTNYTYVWSTGSTQHHCDSNQTGNYTITATSSREIVL
ncbi:MAG: hypothetical protein IPN13_12575 [Bacteroidetes bacterium]|nr:hypothetical protein [Bacteroidota bacterium]